MKTEEKPRGKSGCYLSKHYIKATTFRDLKVGMALTREDGVTREVDHIIHENLGSTTELTSIVGVIVDGYYFEVPGDVTQAEDAPGRTWFSDKLAYFTYQRKKQWEKMKADQRSFDFYEKRLKKEGLELDQIQAEIKELIELNTIK